MSNVMTIGNYQLENLLKNGVQFTFLDLREGRSSDHPLLHGSRKVSAADVRSFIDAQGLSKDAPIVLICENGLQSSQVAQTLSENSYLNVYVLAGGMSSL